VALHEAIADLDRPSTGTAKERSETGRAPDSGYVRDGRHNGIRRIIMRFSSAGLQPARSQNRTARDSRILPPDGRGARNGRNRRPYGPCGSDPRSPGGPSSARPRPRPDDCGDYATSARMPTLPLDHPEPFAVTLGVMLYPGEDDASQSRARAFASQYLAEPLRRFHADGGALPYDAFPDRNFSSSSTCSSIEAAFFAKSFVRISGSSIGKTRAMMSMKFPWPSAFCDSEFIFSMR